MKQRLVLFLLLLCLPWVGALAQLITIKGKIVDENNEGVPSATIRLKRDAGKGTTSRMDGSFSLQVKKGEIIVISYVGYKTQELVAKDGLRVRLEPDMAALDDVVVVGYMPRKVTTTSASVVKVTAETLSAKPVANPLDAIQGKVSGLQVFSSSGEPSAQLSIALHGQGSIGAGTAPLFIMDGMPVSGNVVRSMNSNDIENIQFLKDAAATSIYGARAANGVVHITTKRGQSGERARIAVRAQYGVSSLANTDYFDQLMTGPELLRYYRETGLYTGAQLAQLEETIFKGTDFRWYKYIYQPAPMYTADASIAGGSGATNYYLSGGIMSQKGLRMGSSYDKAFARLNLNTQLNPYIRATLNTSASYDNSRVSPFGNSDASGGGLAALNAPFLSPFDPETGRELDVVPLIDASTPSHVVATKPSKDGMFIFSTTGSLDIRPMRNLILRSQTGVEVNYGTSASRTLPSFRRAYGVGGASRGYGSALNFTTTNTASYQMDFGGHNLTALLGQEYINFSSDNFSASGSGLLDDRLVLLSNVTKDQSVGESNQSFAFLSFFSQMAYGYNNRYFVDLVLRNDASSRFGKNRRNGLFWSLGLLWKAKQESWLQGVNWLNELDVKASYGTQGNSSIPPYAINSYAGKVGQREGGLSMGFASLGNPDLGWERQSKFTLGVKASLWNRVSFNIEYYHRLTTDMLFEVPLSLSTGLSTGNDGYVSRYENVGSYLNHGIDLQVNFTLLKGKDYSLSAYGNINWNRDKVLSLFEGRQEWYEPGAIYGYRVGQPMTFILPLYKGVNPQTGQPEWYKPGSDIWTPTRDDSKVTNEWQRSLEQSTGINARTPVTGGWGIDARWRGLYLMADFAFALGKHIVSMDKQYYENDYHVRNKDGNFNGSRRLFDYWKQPGDVTEYPSLEYVRANRQSNYLDSKMLENASFMRMKNLTIGYHIPQHLLGKQRILTGAKVYFSGRNLLTFTRFRGIDPEVNQSLSFGANPNTKQFSIGAELNF
ncbi:MAG: SusC/RagA family TonB-linked outer membrane protein [Porphyromonas sp.]|nr:SusC/RagA family TonB-linked outer membrane protein [Porphyromonas sp.]